MLIGKRVLCSSANEYYAHWQTSIILLLGDHLLPWLSLLYLRPFSLMNWNDRHLAESHPNKADCQRSCCLLRLLFLTSGTYACTYSPNAHASLHSALLRLALKWRMVVERSINRMINEMIWYGEWRYNKVIHKNDRDEGWRSNEPSIKNDSWCKIAVWWSDP